MDTEPVVNPEQWTHDPFSGHIDREEGYIYGVGTVNMKQSVASFMEALAAIVRSGVSLKGDLLFAGWSQEDLGSIGSKYMATHWDELNLGPLPDMVFDGEQTDCSAWTSNVGMAVFTITTFGRLAHFSSRYTHHPAYRDTYQINAVDKMLKIMNELKQVRKNFEYERGHFLGDPVMSFGKITSTVPGAGGRACLGADSCTLTVDIRFPPGMTKDTCKRDIERIIYNLSIDDPELTATVTTSPALFGMESVPMVSSRDLPLLRKLEAAHKEIFGEDLIVDIDTNGTTTHRSIDWNRYAGSDLTSFYSVGVPGVNYGPGTVPVTPDERVSIPQLINHCKVAALTILEVCEGG
jgi:acetylornithine deacetylase